MEQQEKAQYQAAVHKMLATMVAAKGSDQQDGALRRV
jgi:hypothetical protein